MWSGFRRGDRRRAEPAKLEDAGGVGVVPPAAGAWCLATRNPLFLRPQAPRPQNKRRLQRGRCGASPPAIPYSFVHRHHVHRTNGAVGEAGVVLRHPQSLIPSSTGTTSTEQTAPSAGPAWCLATRNPLFLRPEAPRPQNKRRRLRDRRGASLPAIPYSFVRKHHAYRADWVSGGAGVVPHRPLALIPSSGSTTPTGQTAPSAGPAWCLTARKPCYEVTVVKRR